MRKYVKLENAYYWIKQYLSMGFKIYKMHEFDEYFVVKLKSKYTYRSVIFPKVGNLDRRRLEEELKKIEKKVRIGQTVTFL